MPIEPDQVQGAFAAEIRNARELIQQALNDSSVRSSWDWEIQAAETFGNIHEYAAFLDLEATPVLQLIIGCGIMSGLETNFLKLGIAPMLRFISGCEGMYGLGDETAFQYFEGLE